MQKDNIRYTILIQLSSGNHRWIPKWHGEAWETPLESAVRELEEETGLQIDASQVDTYHTYTEQYISWSKRYNQQVDKTVLYYTAILPYTDITQLSGYSEGDGEILDKKIIPLNDAIVYVTYDNIRYLLQQVKNTL